MVIVEEINGVFDESREISVYNNDVKTSYRAGSNGYLRILDCWNGMTVGAHEMPALGVSIDEYTRSELKEGLWVEFCFGSLYECNGLPFEKLLVKIEEEGYGFNLIRYTEERGYDGRCFYLDLFGKNTRKLYDLLLKMCN